MGTPLVSPSIFKRMDCKNVAENVQFLIISTLIKFLSKEQVFNFF